MWVVKRLDQGGGYLLKPGHKKAFSKRISSKTRFFQTYAGAWAESCKENERPVHIDDILNLRWNNEIS